MEKSMHFKKRRLLEAFGEDQTCQLNSKRQATEDVNITLEIKVQILEQWEISKRKALEALAMEIDELKKKEDEIEAKQLALAKRGLKIDEEVFDRYTSKSDSESQTPSMSSKTNLTNSDSDKSQNSSIPSKTHRTKSSKILAHSTPKLSNDVNESKSMELVCLGPNGTMISKDAIEAINWASPAVATRKLLMEVFDRETLAFHTLTGKPSPAFIDCDKPLKNKLDPIKVEDIIDYVTKNSNVSSKDVRSAITTKCADENKMYRQREKKRKSLIKSNKENILIVNC